MLICKETNGDIIWGIWKIEEDIKYLSSLLDNLDFAVNTHSNKRLLEQVTVRVLLKTLTNEEKKIEYLSSGKPYLADTSYHISISHTKGYVAIILSKTKLVGIDIEYVSSKVQRVRDKFISDKEFIDSDKELNHLLLHWATKETIFKIQDCENISFKENLIIEKFIPEDRGSFLARKILSEESFSYKIFYSVTPDYVLTLSSVENIEKEQ